MKWKELIGKTITKINDKSVNAIKLEFSDGTNIVIEAEAVITTYYGSIYGPVLVSSKGFDFT